MKLCRALAFATAILGFTSAQAEPTPSSAHWRALTAMDVEAAHRIILEDHPASAPAVGDTAFRERLASAYALAKRRAGEVTSYDGYVATMAGLAVALGDKHIWSRPLYTSTDVEWPGLLIGRRGDDWIVVDEDKATGGELLKGARLLACNGISADKLAEQRLGGFKIFWPINAQRIQRATWLLIDEGNPFLTRPQRCTFDGPGKPARTVDLSWRAISRTELSQRRRALTPTYGEAGFALRQVGDGYWIGIEGFNERANPVVDAVRQQAARMRQSPFVVLDLRGNDGGSDHYGRLIADALVGETYVASRLGPKVTEGVCSKAWRTSDRNLAQVRYYRDDLGPRLGKEMAESMKREYETVAAAKAKGQAFTGEVACTRPPLAAVSGARSAFAGRLILLTDNSCFSSCLNVTKQFRELGALHVGQTTDANTHYMEVREDKLPSGLSYFSTLQAVAPSEPRQIGPFEPTQPFAGDIADTAAVEAWVLELTS